MGLEAQLNTEAEESAKRILRNQADADYLEKELARMSIESRLKIEHIEEMNLSKILTELLEQRRRLESLLRWEQTEADQAEKNRHALEAKFVEHTQKHEDAKKESSTKNKTANRSWMSSNRPVMR